MSDPISRNLSNLEKYLNDQPDTLVAYIKYFAKVNEPVIDAELAGAEASFLTLRYKTPTASDQLAKIPFTPPLTGLPEAIPRLTKMAEEAERALGMPKAPRVRKFGLTPPELVKVTLILGTLLYATFAPESGPYAQYFAPGVKIRDVIGTTTLHWTLGAIAVAHVCEAGYMATLAAKHSTGVFLGFAYVASTLFFGVPVFRRFNKNVQQARIYSLIKGQ